MAEKKPPFEGKLVFKPTEDGRWVAGLPAHDITAEEWAEQDYSVISNVTPEQAVSTGLFELKPPRGSGKKEEKLDNDTTDPAKGEAKTDPKDSDKK